MYSLLKAPLTVQWELTYSCNKNCIHCYNYWRDENSGLASTAIFNHKAASKITDEIIKNNVFGVCITGGEPLLVIKEALPYLQKLKNAGIHLSINSNLMAMTDEIASILVSLGIKGVLASFPAGTAALDEKITGSKNSFELTCEGIRICRAHNLNVTTNLVATKLNYNDIYEAAKKAKECGATKFSVNRAMRPANCNSFDEYRISIDEFRNIPYLLKKIKDDLDIEVCSVEANPRCFIDDEKLLVETGCARTCGAGKTFCIFDPNGNIRPCGSINEDYGTDLKKAWEKMLPYRTDEMLPTECKECKYKDSCGGGCKAERLYENGCVKSTDQYANIDNLIPITKSNKIAAPKSTEELAKKYSFSKKLMARNEFDKNYLLYSNSSATTIVTEEIYKFWLQYKKDIFTLKDFSAFLNISDEIAFSTLSYFKMLNIISIID